ncbi:MAG: PLP-dependent aminotransferase family protein [Chitinispirillaceae bacterium]|nr:PLP-dependent aminotransferase family protein [Chitinispirillaceae bacterium]
MRSSEIRRLMALAADPSIISFSGGMPADELFPTTILDEIYAGLSLKAKRTAMQYGPTAGYPPLLDALKEYLRSRGLPLEGQGLIVTTGGQQAINLICKVFLDPGDTVVTENPSFIGALAAFLSYGARLSAAPLDSDGIEITALEKALDGCSSQAKIVYLNPVFQNPAGIIYSEARKKAVLETLAGRDVVLLEDDPYGELYFNEIDKPLTVPLKACGKEPVPNCYVGTFAKIFGPGMRLGWLLGPQAIVEKCELAKQSMDACSPTFTQVLAHEYLAGGRLAGFLTTVRSAYARRSRIMLDALKTGMPEGVSWTTPRGGFYVWVTMPETIDATAVFNESFKRGAAFVVGKAFDPHGTRNNSFRLAFSNTPEERIAEGIAVISSVIKHFLP